MTQKTKMLQLQTAVEEERCRVLQIDGRLEEILETASYFVDRSQDVLEVLTRMENLENNEEPQRIYRQKTSRTSNGTIT